MGGGDRIWLHLPTEAGSTQIFVGTDTSKHADVAGQSSPHNRREAKGQ